MTIEKILPGIKKNILLKNHTTFQIGGPAKYFFVAKTKEDLIEAIKKAKKCHLPFFILGRGSNILVSDKGFKGLVIKTENRNLEIDNLTIRAGAGLSLSKLVNVSIRKSLTGLEWAAGIPGMVGGAIYGNTGAFGKSIADSLKEVTVLEIKNSKPKIKNLSKKNCHFSYKNSIFKQGKNLVILSAKFQLKKGNRSEIKKRIKEYLNYRKEHHPLTFPSAGCIFKNPKLKIRDQKLLKSFPELRKFSRRKEIPAGWLIEESNLKGKKIGDVKISEKHANFIINLGNGKAKDVKRLINLAKQKVKNKFGIVLKEEIEFL